MYHRDVDHVLTCLGEPLVVFAETTVPTKPSEGSLDNPSSGQDDEPNYSHWTQDCLQYPSESVANPIDQFPCIATIGPNQLQARQLVPNFLQHQLGTVTILNVGGMNDHGQKKSQGVDQKVPLPAVDFFSGIITAWPSLLGRLDRLAIQDGSARLLVPTLTLPNSCSQAVMDLFPEPCLAPAPVIPVNRLPRWKVMRNGSPLYAGAHDEHDCINQFAAMILARPPTRLCRGKQMLDVVPLDVRQIAGVRIPFHAAGL